MKENSHRHLGTYQKGGRKRRGSRKTPSLFFDNKNNTFFKKNEENVIFEVTTTQLSLLSNIGLDDIYLSKNHILEPHWHPNAAELDYVISGEVIISILDPLTPRLLTYQLKKGDVVFVPLNWWHWIIAVTDRAHVVAFYDNANRQNMFGSDMLRKTPPEVFQLVYKVNGKQLSEALDQITETVVIGPANSVSMGMVMNEMSLPMYRAGVRKSAESPLLFFDVSKNVNFRRNAHNILYEVTSEQIPSMQDLALGDLFMSKNHIREPHWHPNADELDYIVSGEANISILNPFTLQLQSYHVKPGQVIFIPQGWWHWITAVTDEVHLLVCFNDSKIQFVEGSDVLRLTPPQVFQLAYNVNIKEVQKVFEPIDKKVVIGPPDPKAIW